MKELAEDVKVDTVKPAADTEAEPTSNDVKKVSSKWCLLDELLLGLDFFAVSWIRLCYNFFT